MRDACGCHRRGLGKTSNDRGGRLRFSARVLCAASGVDGDIGNRAAFRDARPRDTVTSFRKVGPGVLGRVEGRDQSGELAVAGATAMLVSSLWMLTGFVLLALFRVTDPEFAWAGAALAGIAGMLFTSRFANRIPRTHSTVRDLVPFAVTSTEISWSPNDVAWQVKKLVMEQLGVSEKDYREDAHFIHDFGMD